MSVSLIEKIKQAFVEGTCIVYGKRRHWRYDGPDYARTRCESIIELYEEKTIPAIQEKVLKILSDGMFIPHSITERDSFMTVLKSAAAHKNLVVIEKQKFEKMQKQEKVLDSYFLAYQIQLQSLSKLEKEKDEAKQKIQEKLMRLMCLRAGSIYFADEENGMKLLLVELLTGRKLKNRRQIDAFLHISRCKSLDEARAKLDLFGVESTKKETTK